MIKPLARCVIVRKAIIFDFKSGSLVEGVKRFMLTQLEKIFQYFNLLLIIELNALQIRLLGKYF